MVDRQRVDQLLALLGRHLRILRELATVPRDEYIADPRNYEGQLSAIAIGVVEHTGRVEESADQTRVGLSLRWLRHPGAQSDEFGELVGAKSSSRLPQAADQVFPGFCRRRWRQWWPARLPPDAICAAAAGRSAAAIRGSEIDDLTSTCQRPEARQQGPQATGGMEEAFTDFYTQSRGPEYQE